MISRKLTEPRRYCLAVRNKDEVLLAKATPDPHGAYVTYEVYAHLVKHYRKLEAAHNEVLYRLTVANAELMKNPTVEVPEDSDTILIKEILK